MAPTKRTTIEDDVDDLDDVIEQFNAPSTSSAQPQTQEGFSSAPEKEPELNEDDFAKQFATEMEEFMKSISGPEATAAGPVDPKIAQEAESLKKMWEQMLINDLEGNKEGNSGEAAATASTSKPTDSPGTTGATESAPSTEDAFQKAVRQAMDKLKKSNEANDVKDNEGDLAALLSAFSGLNVDGEGDMQGALESLMGQLMSKEILYEPLKELHEKFPGYLEANKDQLSSEDRSRYDKQVHIVAKVIAIFETPGYSDTNPTTTAEIVGLMSEMQEYGSPPTEIMGALPPGIETGPDGLPDLDDKCIIL